MSGGHQRRPRVMARRLASHGRLLVKDKVLITRFLPGALSYFRDRCILPRRRDQYGQWVDACVQSSVTWVA